jgi:hypothetical protein
VLVARLDGCNRILGLDAFPETDGAVRAIRPFPAAVAVHRVVPAADGREPIHRQFCEIARGGVWRDVASVGEGVHPHALLHTLALRQREQRAEVVDVGVNAAVRHEPEQVDVSHALAGAVKRGDERVVLGERPVLDRAVHPREVLEEDAPRADREMADLGVAHLPHRKTDCLAGRGERSVRVSLEESIEHGRICELDGIPGAGRCDPPSVEDDEDDRAQTASAAARQIASNDARSSEAPPTSAPSTSGRPRRTPAFSGFTEPP